MMNKNAVLMSIAFICALTIVLFSQNRSYEERLIRASLVDVLGADAQGLLSESLELQALYIDYSDAPELVFKARIAISKYRNEARNILITYGAEQEFRDILQKYGENVVPVIQYFIENDPFSVRMAHETQQGIQNVVKETKDYWNGLFGKPVEHETANVQPVSDQYNPQERGRHAIHNIRLHGHDFLGQFEVDANNKAKWIQTERISEGINSLFASGIRNIETKSALDQEIKSLDFFWAGVDAAVVLSMVKALRIVKVARTAETVRGAEVAGQAVRTGEVLKNSSKELGLFYRTKLLATRLVPKSEIGRMILKGGAVVGLIYVVVNHPGLLNSIFAEAAKFLGMNPFLTQIVCWAVLIYALCWPLITILRLILPPVIKGCTYLGRVLQGIERFIARRDQKNAISEPKTSEAMEPA